MLIASFEKMAADCLGKHTGFERAGVAADMMVRHCRLTWPGIDQTAGIEISRFDVRGKPVEHRDVLQVVAQDQAHVNEMFQCGHPGQVSTGAIFLRKIRPTIFLRKIC